ncbi:MAG: hypothetical protein K2M36_03690 [Clostridia bacterium]|nr:hypothetical protein [Clostridia bacterium]
MENKEIVKYRQEFIWHYVIVYLDNLQGTGAMYDEKFKLLFKELYDYAISKCDTELDGDIVDYYMVVEKAIKNTSDK